MSEQTPAQQAGWAVGDRGVVTAEGGSVCEPGSIVEFYQDDGDSIPLFRLIEGDTPFRCCDGEPGAYLHLNSVERQP